MSSSLLLLDGYWIFFLRRKRAAVIVFYPSSSYFILTVGRDPRMDKEKSGRGREGNRVKGKTLSDGQLIHQ